MGKKFTGVSAHIDAVVVEDGEVRITAVAGATRATRVANFYDGVDVEALVASEVKAAMILAEMVDAGVDKGTAATAVATDDDEGLREGRVAGCVTGDARDAVQVKLTLGGHCVDMTADADAVRGLRRVFARVGQSGSTAIYGHIVLPSGPVGRVHGIEVTLRNGCDMRKASEEARARARIHEAEAVLTPKESLVVASSVEFDVGDFAKTAVDPVADAEVVRRAVKTGFCSADDRAETAELREALRVLCLQREGHFHTEAAWATARALTGLEPAGRSW